MNTDEMQANFARHAQANAFYAVRCEFFAEYREHIYCCMFFRPESERRQAAYCLALYQYQYDARFACAESHLGDLFDILRVMSCSPDSLDFQEVDRELLSSHIAHSDLRPLWCSGYGVSRHDGDFHTTTLTAWPGVDIAF